jgi:hypothetical protein
VLVGCDFKSSIDQSLWVITDVRYMTHYAIAWAIVVAWTEAWALPDPPFQDHHTTMQDQ